jgi:hypothetical protein
MSFERVHRSKSQRPQSSLSTSQFAPRPFPVQKPERPLTQEDIENEAFQQNKFEAFGLQLKEKHGTITPVEQEKLGMLQAKMDSFWTQRMERAKAQPNLLEILIRNAQSAQATEPAAPVQPKLTIGQPNDQYEQEADRVAEQVMSMAPPVTSNIQRQAEEEQEEVQTKPLAETITPIIQRQEEVSDEEPIQTKCEACEQEENIQRSSNGRGQTQSNLESRLSASKGGGSSLSDEVRSFMEPRFRTNFSQVRVHTNNEAMQMNQELNAQAFTHKQDIYFGSGKNPENNALTAHELAHVVQQRATAISLKPVTAQSESEWALTHPGEIEEVAVGGDSPSNEFVFWNLLVSSAVLPQEHQNRLHSDIIPRWQSLLKNRSDLQIKIIGSASASGKQSGNEKLATARAIAVRDLLTTGGIPTNRIEVVSVGNRQPFADENVPDAEVANQNKARNRRVEFFLFVPTQVVKTLDPGVRPRVHSFDAVFSQEVSANIDPSKNSFTDIAGRTERGASILVTANVELDGLPGSEIGFLQILTQDIRQGIYRSSDRSQTLVLDYSRCSDVPCRDVLEASLPFSLTGEGRSVGSPTGGLVDLKFNDSPGFVLPLKVSESGDFHNSGAKFILEQTDWFMQFAVVLGVRQGMNFLALKNLVWSVSSSRTGISRGIAIGQPRVGEISRGDGMPAAVNLSSATSLATCRFMTRRMDNPLDSGVCRPSVSK